MTHKELLDLKIEYFSLQELQRDIVTEFNHYNTITSMLERDLDEIEQQQQELQKDYDEMTTKLRKQNDWLGELDIQLATCLGEIREIINVFQEQGVEPNQVYSMEELEKAGQFTMSQDFEG